MKLLTSILFIFISFMTYCAPVLDSESGPGNGTDYVKVLFAKARQEAIDILDGVTKESISHLNIEESFKEWLMIDVEGSPRYIKLKFYAANFKFKFQKETCPQENSICFYKNPNPLIVVSLKENQQTTDEQALIMLFHEIGHFTGEYDHLFLDRFGSELAATSATPFVLVEEQNKRYVASIFEAANDCEKGVGEQVDNLKNKIRVDISQQCLKRKLKCELDKIEFSFEAKLPTLGGGFDSTSLCKAKGLLKALRIKK